MCNNLQNVNRIKNKKLASDNVGGVQKDPVSNLFVPQNTALEVCGADAMSRLVCLQCPTNKLMQFSPNFEIECHKNQTVNVLRPSTFDEYTYVSLNLS